MVVLTEHPSLHAPKGRLNQQTREINGAWQVTAVLLLASFVVENVLFANIWEVPVKLLS